MNLRLLRMTALIVSLAMIGMVLTSVAIAGLSEQEKPILYMTPADIFSDPQVQRLAEAAQRGDVDEISRLVAKGVNVNAKGKYGITPLYSAVQVGNEAGFNALLEHGANPNIVMSNGDTLLNNIASSSPDPNFMRMALKYDGNPNLVAPRTGATPLLAAITVTGKVNIPLLIKSGANLNQQMPISRETALMEAIDDAGQFDVVYELLVAGADYKLQDAHGWDIRDYVRNSFSDNVSPEQQQWRKRVIVFLKEHSFLLRIPWPGNPRVNYHVVKPGEAYILSWDKVVGATWYDLQVNQHEVKTGITSTEYSVVAPPIHDTVDGFLFWNVRACNTHECSGWSSAITVRVRSADKR